MSHGILNDIFYALFCSLAANNMATGAFSVVKSNSSAIEFK
jgi:hypothetical protein